MTHTYTACKGLKKVTLPSTLTSIGRSFDNCPNIEIINCYAETPPTIVVNTFTDNYNDCIVYVPRNSVEVYKNANIWKNFKYIFALDNGQETKQCATPIISYNDGTLAFTCSTDDVEYHYSISDADVVSNAYSKDGVIELAAAYNISVYATATGYETSETSTATLYWLNGNETTSNMNSEPRRGIIVSSNDGIVYIKGLASNEEVRFYTVNGVHITTLRSTDGTVSLSTNEPIVITKIGKDTIKIKVL